MSVASTLEEMVLELMVKGIIDRKTQTPRYELLQRDLADKAKVAEALAELGTLIRGENADASHSYTRTLALLEQIRRELFEGAEDPMMGVPTAITYDREVDTAVLHSMQTEITEKCHGMEHELLLLERSPESVETVLELLGHLHSVKGIAGFTELTAVMKMAHVAESALMKYADEAVPGEVTSALFRVVDMFRSIVGMVVEHAKNGNNRRQLRLPPTYTLLYKDLVKLHDADATPMPMPLKASGSYTADLDEQPFLDQLHQTSSSLTRSSALKKTSSIHDDELYEEFNSALDLQRDDMDNIFGNLVIEEAPSPAAAAPKAAAAPAASTSSDLGNQVRVSMSRLDELGEMVGETVIAYTQLATDPQMQKSLSLDLERKLSRVSNALRLLQATSMNLRLFPFSTVLTPLRRAARDVADKQGKKIHFSCDGEETELDKGVLQDLSEPLVHLIRNAIDHGLEMPEEREAAGKDATGSLSLKVEGRRGKVIVTLTDDGRGLDRQRIVAKAIDMGLIRTDEGMSDAAVWDLIFAPGFSTAATLTEISGRGVGMDVVKRRVERLSGSIRVETEPGAFTRIELSLPLTLAMFDGLLLRVGPHTYIVPQSSVDEVIRPRATQIDSVHQRGVMLSLRGQSMPLVRLQDYVGLAGDIQHPCDGTVLISRTAGAAYGLMVDAVIGRQPVVLRSISEALPNYRGVSGCAILGDGSLGLVLDMDEIYSHVNLQQSKTPTPAAAS